MTPLEMRADEQRRTARIEGWLMLASDEMAVRIVRRDLRRARKERDARRWGLGLVLTLIVLVLGAV